MPRIKDLTAKSGNLSNADFFATDNGTIVTKIDYTALAKAIIEQYNGSTLAGSAQSVQAALNSLNSKLGDYLRQVAIAGNGSGTFTYPSGKFGLFVWSVGTAPAGLHFLYTNSSGVQAIKVYATSESYNPTFAYSNGVLTITNTGGSYLRGSLVFT